MKKFLLILFALPAILIYGQGNEKLDTKQIKVNPEDQEILNTAESLFKAGKYFEALDFYQYLDEHYPDLYYTYRLGICYLYHPEQKEKALQALETVREKKPNLDQLYYQLGRAHHINHNFSKAKEYFNLYSSTAKPGDETYSNTQLYLKQVANAELIVARKFEYDLNLLPGQINTKDGEYSPFISADGKTIYFTYKGEKSTGGIRLDYGQSESEGEYYEDVFFSAKDASGNWGEPQSITEINTEDHEAVVGLSPDNKSLLVYKSKTGGGDLYISTNASGAWSVPVKLSENVNSKYWEGSAALSTDNTLFFSSDRPGGKGKRDLYFSKLQADGTYGPASPINELNTPYNEDAPLITSDGKMMFFSSDGESSIGGYDIFYSKYENGKWGSPINMGYPLNTETDQLFYSLDHTATTGYFAAIFPDGKGYFDIYSVKPAFKSEAEYWAKIEAKVLSSGNPIVAKIRVTDDNKEVHQELISSEAGLAVIRVPKNKNFKIEFAADKHQPEVRTITPADWTSEFLTMEVTLKAEEPILAAVEKKQAEQREAEKPVEQKKDEVIAAKATGEVNQVEKPIESKNDEVVAAKSKDEVKQAEKTIAANVEKAEANKEAAKAAEPVTKAEAVKPAEKATAAASKPAEKTGKVKPVEPVAKAEPAKSTESIGNVTASAAAINTIYYDLNLASVPEKYRSYLDELASKVKESMDVRVVLNGHSDGQGAEDYNMDLSSRRAKLVRVYLASKGVPYSRIMTRSFGKSSPAAEEKNADGSINPDAQAKNRRVEIILENAPSDFQAPQAN